VPVDLNDREQWNRGAGGILPCGMPKMSINRDGVTTLETSGATMEEFAGRILQRSAGRLVWIGRG
jgi:hypothetical protein